MYDHARYVQPLDQRERIYYGICLVKQVERVLVLESNVHSVTCASKAQGDSTETTGKGFEYVSAMWFKSCSWNYCCPVAPVTATIAPHP
jgi:hypothetical protein